MLGCNCIQGAEQPCLWNRQHAPALERGDSTAQHVTSRHLTAWQGHAHNQHIDAGTEQRECPRGETAVVAIRWPLGTALPSKAAHMCLGEAAALKDDADLSTTGAHGTTSLPSALLIAIQLIIAPTRHAWQLLPSPEAKRPPPCCTNNTQEVVETGRAQHKPTTACST
jgi:hypothetical protein